MIDTNILVYAHDGSSPHQERAATILKDSLEGRVEAVISTQNITELFSVLTNRRRVEKPLNSQEAERICKLYLVADRIPKIVPDEDCVQRALELASELKLAGGDFFDCMLAATMEHSGVKRIFTENVSDFERFSFVQPISPFKGKPQSRSES